MDPIILLEMGIVALIVAVQFFIFTRNRGAIKQLARIFPPLGHLHLQTAQQTEHDELSLQVSTSFKLLADHQSFHQTFREIIHATNAYLTRHQGQVEAEALQELADNKVTPIVKAIESNIAMPLYLGLLGTFTGVIIGLVKISLVGVSDAAIQSFIGGVLIGMIASATGLALTVICNHLFKDYKLQRDRDQYEYFQFLGGQLVPSRAVQQASSAEDFRQNLKAFHEGFARYQQHVNGSLTDSLRLFQEYKAVAKEMGGIKQELQGIGQVLRDQDGLMEKQVNYLDTYAKRAEALTEKLNRRYAEADQQLRSLVQENLHVLEHQTQSAFAQAEHVLSGAGSLNGHSLNGHHAGHAQPDWGEWQEEQQLLYRQLAENLQQSRQNHQSMHEQFQVMNHRLLALATKNDKGFMKSREFRIFIYVGIAAFVVGIAGRLIQILNPFAG